MAGVTSGHSFGAACLTGQHAYAHPSGSADSAPPGRFAACCELRSGRSAGRWWTWPISITSYSGAILLPAWRQVELGFPLLGVHHGSPQLRSTPTGRREEPRGGAPSAAWRCSRCCSRSLGALSSDWELTPADCGNTAQNATWSLLEDVEGAENQLEDAVSRPHIHDHTVAWRYTGFRGPALPGREAQQVHFTDRKVSECLDFPGPAAPLLALQPYRTNPAAIHSGPLSVPLALCRAKQRWVLSFQKRAFPPPAGRISRLSPRPALPGPPSSTLVFP